MEAVNAHPYVFGLVVSSADDLIAAGDVVGDPLDGEVVAVDENFDLGVVSLSRVNGEDIAGHEHVAGIVVAIDWCCRVGEALQGRGRESVEIDRAEIYDSRAVLRRHLAEDGS